MLKTLNQSLKVLELFATEKNKWTANEIAKELDMPKINVYRILETFTHNQYLVKSGETRQYELGPAFMAYCHLSQAKYNVYALVRPILDTLMKQTGESVYLVKPDLPLAQNIDSAIPENKLSFAVSLNEKYPLYAGASYWSILAYLPKEKIQQVLSEPFTALRHPELLTNELLQKQLDFVKEMGWCASYELLTSEIAAIASPIFSGDQIAGSITVAKPVYRTTEKDLPMIGELTCQSAAEISALLSEHHLSLDSYIHYKNQI